MKGLLKILSFILLFGCIVCGIFFGRLFLMGYSFQKDLEELDSYDFELMYHISGDSDMLDIGQYETEDRPVVTQWFASYIEKMEQGGKIYGQMRDRVYHADVCAEGESQSSIEFYYGEQAVFGIKKTMDYIISSVAEETKLPISLLQKVTPEGYITLEQIKTILGASEDAGTSVDFVKLGAGLLGELRLILPASVKDNYFQQKLDGVEMSYGLAKTKLNGKDVKLYAGISNETYHKYVYIRIEDVAGNEGSNLEMLLHINVTDGDEIVMPKTISDDTVDLLAAVISIINGR